MKKLLLPALLAVLCGLSSCRVFYPDLMFKTDPEYEFAVPDSFDRGHDYTIRPGDVVSLSVLSNNGYQLVDILGTSTVFIPLEYTVRSNGFCTFPLIDSIYIAGMTVAGLENVLVEKYAYYFLRPYIRIEVVSNRVLVFTQRSVGRVVRLENERVQLLEVLAAAGALTGNKLYRVKVIRGEIKNPEVFLFDFSSIEGYKNTDFLVTNQDVIYVEPSLTLADVNARILPVLTTLSTIVLIYTAIQNINP